MKNSKIFFVLALLTTFALVLLSGCFPLRERASEIKKIDKQIAKLNLKAQELEKKNKELDEIKEKASALLAEVNTQLEEGNKKMEELNNSINYLNSRVRYLPASKVGEYNRLANKFNSLIPQVNSLASNLNSSMKEVLPLRDEVNRKRVSFLKESQEFNRTLKKIKIERKSTLLLFSSAKIDHLKKLIKECKKNPALSEAEELGSLLTRLDEAISRCNSFAKSYNDKLNEMEAIYNRLKELSG